ncbi:hypothetical protein [Ekhidna sp.]|uniref:hypothetical protein n=1 Tax=Ekhidna sp. TaxID=2608089 RepID=UPI003BAAA530
MILSWLTSAGNNLVEKTKNPFLGTFTLVWLARNWELVFALFNFDDSYNLDSKIEFLSERIKYDTFWTEVWWNIVWTFTVLVLTYLLINIARAISNLFEKRLSPLIYKWTDYKSLVPKSEYQSILDRMNDLQVRLEKEIQERLKAQSERDEYEEKYNIQILENSGSEDSTVPIENPAEKNESIEYSKEIRDLVGGFTIEDLEYTLNLVKNQNPIWFNVKYEAIAHNLFEKGYFENQRKEENGTRYDLSKKGENLISSFSNNSEFLTLSKSTNSPDVTHSISGQIQKIKSDLRKVKEEPLDNIFAELKKYKKKQQGDFLYVMNSSLTNLPIDTESYIEILGDLIRWNLIQKIDADEKGDIYATTDLGVRFFNFYQNKTLPPK